MNHTKTNWIALMAAGALSLGTVACTKKEPAQITTLETLNTKDEIQVYKQNDTDVQKMKVEKAFAQLDQEIRELEIRVQSTSGEDKAKAEYKLGELKKRAGELRADYDQARFDALIKDIRESVPSAH